MGVGFVPFCIVVGVGVGGVGVGGVGSGGVGVGGVGVEFATVLSVAVFASRSSRGVAMHPLEDCHGKYNHLPKCH